MSRVSYKYNSSKFKAEYFTWHNMKRRCCNKHSPEYPNYGGRGIKVCERWLEKQGFDNFMDDMGERPEGCSLDRIDVNGDYCPENCRWADLLTQNNNRRTNRYVTIKNRTQTIMEWSRESGVSWDTIHDRIERGWGEDRLLQKEDSRYRIVTIKGETHTFKYWCNKYNLSRSTLFFRLQSGCPEDKLLLPSRKRKRKNT